MKNTIIVAHSPGQMGNILVQLAHITAFCIEHQIELYAPTISDLGEVFSRSYGSLAKIYPLHTEAFDRKSTQLDKLLRKSRKLLIGQRTTARSYGTLLGTINLAGNKHTIDLESPEFASFVRRNRFTLLSGWRFRAPNLVLKHRSIIKQVFKFKSEYYEAANKILAPHGINGSSGSVVGVHVRLKDYRNTNYYYPVHSYIEIMQSAQSVLNASLFVVCSDEEIQDYIPTPLKCIFPKSTAIIDLLCLSHCDFIVGPPSTFSGWAAFIENVPSYQIQDRNFSPQYTDFIANRVVDGPCQNPVLIDFKTIYP